MKKGSSVFLLLCLAIFTLTTPISAQSANDSVLVHPLFFDDGSTIPVSSDQEVILGIGWAACTPGLERAFIQAVHLDWTIDGQPVLPDNVVKQYWGEINQVDIDYDCLVGNGLTWGSSWRYSLGYLEPGEYTIHFLEWLDHQVLDGGDNDGDGKLDHFSGTLTDWSIKLVVTASP